MTLNGMKIKLSGEKNQKLIGTDRVRRIFKAHYADIRIISML